MTAPTDAADANYSAMPGFTVTENNKYKGAMVISAFDGLIESVNSEAESQTEAALDITFNAIGAAASAVQFVTDPFGALLGEGIGWMMEHMDPLKEALDKLTGDPDEIQANVQATKDLAAEARIAAEDQKAGLASYSGWEGASSDNYRASMEALYVELDSTAKAVDTKAKIVSVCGLIVQLGRDLIRDMIATAIGKWLSTVVAGAVGAVWTFGLSVAAAAAKLAADVAALALEIGARIAKIIAALAKLASLGGKLDDALKMISKGWDRFENLADVLEVSYEGYKAVDDVNDNTDKKVAENEVVKKDAADVTSKSDAASAANDKYSDAKKNEEAANADVKTAGDKLNTESQQAQDAGKKAQDAADKAETANADAKKAADKVEQAAKSGDREAYDKAKAEYDKKVALAEQAVSDFDKAKAVADAEQADAATAAKDLAAETQQAKQAADASYQALQDTKTPQADLDAANKAFDEKYGSTASPEAKAAKDDFSVKNDAARADQEAFETANKDYAAKNAAAAEANAKAFETGSDADIAAAKKASEQAQAAGTDLKTKADTAKASGEAAKASFETYKTHLPPA